MKEILQMASGVRNPYLDRFLEAGGQAVGICCVCTPREIFDAAGLLPVRIRALGSSAKDLADAHMSRFNCSFCRSCLQLGLDGSYDFLSGLVETNGCDHLRGMFENWQGARPSAFFHYLKVPHLKHDDALQYYVEEVGLLRRSVAAHFSMDISDDALREAVERQDRIRDKLQQIFKLRERPVPALSGAESLALTLLESCTPPEDFEGLLDRAMEQCRHGRLEGHRARLLLAGSATDELDLVREMEAVGAVFVTDALCYSARAYWAPAATEEDDPLRVLARAYLENQLCPRMFEDYASRLEFILGAARRARVDGVILVHNKFCDLHGVDNAQLRMDLERRGVPVLVLEKEYGAGSDQGRIATRVQAFLERLGC